METISLEVWKEQLFPVSLKLVPSSGCDELYRYVQEFNLIYKMTEKKQ